MPSVFLYIKLHILQFRRMEELGDQDKVVFSGVTTGISWERERWLQ
jgi:hypothetical protein